MASQWLAELPPEIFAPATMCHITCILKPHYSTYLCRLSLSCSIWINLVMAALIKLMWVYMAVILSAYVSNCTVGVEIPARHAKYIRSVIQKFMENQGLYSSVLLESPDGLPVACWVAPEILMPAAMCHVTCMLKPHYSIHCMGFHCQVNKLVLISWLLWQS